MSEWESIESAPEEGTEFLATDGKLVGIGERWTRIEPETKLLGYDEGVRYLDGSLKIGARFSEHIPNPNVGQITKGIHCSAIWAFHKQTETLDDEGHPRFFEPTHWMLFPPPPEEKAG